jgi:hypothetical protein
MYDGPDEEMHSGLSRRMPCSLCGHDEHVLKCGALVDLLIVDVFCPCRDVPVPGVYA